jgi:hypothetical protein
MSSSQHWQSIKDVITRYSASGGWIYEHLWVLDQFAWHLANYSLEAETISFIKQ